ncbi:MAG TPA: putative Ig domain-containing protein [Candidatus Binatia bacterium]|nr:putative Ig domain-containing protein [Candidatus Binatia bacterium]
MPRVIRRLGLTLPLFVCVLMMPVGPGCSDCDLQIDTAMLADGTVGASYSQGLHSDCGGDFWFLQEGNLPPGIGLLERGELRGTPSTPGVFHFTVGVVDEDSHETAFKGFALTVKPGPPATASPSAS